MKNTIQMAIAGMLSALLLGGCEGAVSPETEPEKYAQLVRVAAAEMRAEEDTTRLWLRNNPNPRISDLMLDLKVDYVRYDARRGVVCAWAGGGMMPARGFVYRLPPSSTLPLSSRDSVAADSTASGTASPKPVPTDSLGDVCYRSGRCAEEPLTGDWTRFECP